MGINLKWNMKLDIFSIMQGCGGQVGIYIQMQLFILWDVFEYGKLNNFINSGETIKALPF